MKTTIDSPVGRRIVQPSQIKYRETEIEFRSERYIPTWIELQIVALLERGKKIHFQGIIIACPGNSHTGYTVSMYFTSLSRQATEFLKKAVAQV